MSVIINKMSVAKPVIVELADMPLDARTRCNNVDDFPNIETPFIGMLIYTIDDGKFWVVTKLKAKLIGSMSVENMQIDEYAEFVGGSGGGAEYTAGEGISITDGAISVNFNTVAKKADIVNYSAGAGISISSAGVISCSVTPGESIEYTAGDGLLLVGSEFEVDFEVVAKKSDIPDGTTDYNALENKPIIAAGAGVTVEIIKGGSLLVSGAGDETTNGTYEMVDQAAEGTARVWQKEGRKLYNDGTKWLFDDDTDASSFYYSSATTDDPWGATFTAALETLGTAPTVALIGTQDVTTIAPDFNVVAKKSEVTAIMGQLGDIDDILDDINGEEI